MNTHLDFPVFAYFYETAVLHNIVTTYKTQLQFYQATVLVALEVVRFLPEPVKEERPSRNLECKAWTTGSFEKIGLWGQKLVWHIHEMPLALTTHKRNQGP